MNGWYTDFRAQQLKKRARLYGIIIAAMLAGTLAGCVFLCTQVNTGNAARLLPITIGLSTVGGWMAIVLMVFGYKPARAQAAHTAGLLDAAEERHTGKLTVSPQNFAIPGSIAVRKAKLETEQETLSFNLNARCGAALPAPGTLVCITVRRTFIAGVEVQE